MTSFCLKIIAVIAMTIDHTAKIIGQMGLMMIFPQVSQSMSYSIMQMMDWIGRIAFPLYAFLIAEGASRTRSMPRYIGRLTLFAVLSEPFFYFAFHRPEPTLAGLLENLSRLNLTNVFFTLALGAAAIYVCRKLEESAGKKRLWILPVCLIFAFAAEYIDADYGMAGVLLIVGLYLAKSKGKKCVVIAVWALWLYVISYGFYASRFNVMEGLFAALACVPVWLYNGKRGKPVKWCFYIYYPAHLLILTCLGRML